MPMVMRPRKRRFLQLSWMCLARAGASDGSTPVPAGRQLEAG